METINDEVLLENEEIKAVGSLRSYIEDLKRLVAYKDRNIETRDDEDEISKAIDNLLAELIGIKCKLIYLIIDNPSCELYELYEKYLNEDKFLPVDVRKHIASSDDVTSVKLLISRIGAFCGYIEDLI